MPRTPARFTQADLARAVRAVEQAGEGWRIRVTKEGEIVVEKVLAQAAEPTLDHPARIVL